MSQQHRELVSRFNDRWASQDLDGVLECVTDDFVFDWSESRSPFKGVYRGHEGLMQYWADQVEAWEEFDIEELETISIDADRLISVDKVRGLGKTSGIVLEAVGAMLWTVREGKLRSAKLCQSKEEALEVARVSATEPGPPTPEP